MNHIYSNKLISRISVEGQIAQINDTLFVDVWKRYKELKDDAPQSDELKEDYVYINLYPCDWDIFYTIKHTKLYKKNYCSKREGDWYLRSACHDFSIKIDTPFNKNVTVGNTICLYNKYESFVCNKKYQSDGYKIGQVFVKKGHVCLYDGSSLYSLNHSGYWEYDRKCKINLEYYDEFGVIEDINTKTYELENGKNIGCFNRIMRINEPFFRTNNVYVFSRGRALKNSDTDIPEYLSHSLKYGITVNEKGVFLYSLHKDKYVERQILINIFDKSKFSNVLLSEDGDSLLYQDGKCSVMLNLIDQSTEIFDNLSYVKHVNGIRPLFSKPSSLQPKVINPITKQMINCEMLEQYKFVSPDGRLYADTQLYDYIECFRRTDNRLISKEEYLSLKRKYDIPFNANAAEKERLKELREKFLLENIDFLIEEEPQIFKENEDEESISITEYVLGKPVDEFLSYLIGMRGIAIIRNMEDDNIVAKIDLGEPLWFLNYVSFSYDNRYVAIAGRYPNKSNSGGLFLVYDLLNQRVIHEQTNSWAVWLTAFNQDGLVAAYSSEPITYKTSVISESKIHDYNGYSFLTFSPDGKFAALSKQGYISKYNKKGNERLNWGHQPSCLVYIVPSLDFDDIKLELSDLSDVGIEGCSSRKCTVSSVSFSNNNKRIMMVGNDGVIIIRNIDIDK